MLRKLTLFPLALAILCVSAHAQTTREDLVDAVKALAEKPNYTWATSVKVPEGTRFAPGPSTGKMVKDGPIYATSTRGDNTTEIVKLGDKAAVTNREGEWQSLTEIEAGGGFGRFTISLVEAIRLPAQDALEWIEGLENIEKDGNQYSGNLSEKAATELANASSGSRRRGASNVLFAKASVSFAVENGVLTRMEQHLDASMDFNGSEFIVERVTTTSIENVGTTSVEIPAGAKAKLE
jgi:hypothetical protein